MNEISTMASLLSLNLAQAQQIKVMAVGGHRTIDQNKQSWQLQVLTYSTVHDYRQYSCTGYRTGRVLGIVLNQITRKSSP